MYLLCCDSIGHLEGQPRNFILLPLKNLPITDVITVYDITDGIEADVDTYFYCYKLKYDTVNQRYYLDKSEMMV